MSLVGGRNGRLMVGSSGIENVLTSAPLLVGQRWYIREGLTSPPKGWKWAGRKVDTPKYPPVGAIKQAFFKLKKKTTPLQDLHEKKIESNLERPDYSCIHKNTPTSKSAQHWYANVQIGLYISNMMYACDLSQCSPIHWGCVGVCW